MYSYLCYKQINPTYFERSEIMTLRHIKIYVTVCECGSVTEAANKLFIAQPTVSLVIKELEEYYGVRLFDRISRKLHITEPGKLLLNYANHIVSLFDKMENEIKNSVSYGTLKVGSSITIGNYLIPPVIQHFKMKFPNVNFHVTIDNSRKIEELVFTNKIDFGLIEGTIHNPQIKSKEFMNDELVLLCGKGHPLYKQKEVELEKIKDYDFILREKGSGSRELLDSTMLIHGVEIQPVLESISTQSIIRAVSSGLGLTLLPYLLVKKDIETGDLYIINLKGITFYRNFFIIYHQNKYFTQPAKDFIDICLNKSIIDSILQ